MQPSPDTRLIVLVGPTAGGKSELAVALAERLGGEVLSADSMQVYRHMNAGTAKPDASLRARAPHHLLDIVEPTERFTVADWLAQAEAIIPQIQARGRRPIVVGGTNLYLRALLEGLFEGPSMDADYRRQLDAFANDQLHARLQSVDPASAQRIHPNDRKKMVRALEVFHLTGEPISLRQTQWTDGEFVAGETADAEIGPARYRHDPILLGLEWPVEAINRRINARVKAMFSPPAPGPGHRGEPGEPGGPGGPEGLVAESLPHEVERLEAAGLLGLQAREALGYKQVLEWLAGQCSLEEAFERTKILTRRFAKTQRTWLKRYRQVAWLPAEGRTATDLLEPALDAVRHAVRTV